MASPLDTASIDIGRTFGAILLGAFIACGMSGMVVIQCIVYFKLYPLDSLSIKGMVIGSWLLDVVHTTFVFAAVWDYFIKHFGNPERFDHIPWTVAFSVVITAVQTCFVQCFFAHKIFRSSRRNWWITSPIVILSLLRLAFACVSTAEMVQLARYSAFTEAYPGWVFTTGLSLSVGVDLLIMFWMCYFLHKLRDIAIESTTYGNDPYNWHLASLLTTFRRAIKVINALTLYTLENGALTCLTALASLITWLAMPENLIFLGLHFVIAKFYANSFLASLNTRKELLDLQSRMQITKTTGAHRNTRSTETGLHIRGSMSENTIRDTRLESADPGMLSQWGGRGGARVVQFRRGSPSLWTRLLEAPRVEVIPLGERTKSDPASSK